MELIIRKRDMYITALVLLACAAVGIHHHYDSQQIDRDLRAFAKNSLLNLLGEDANLDEWDVVCMVDQAKSFHVAGPAWGAIHTFVRRKGDEEMKTFKGIEYYLKRSEGEWIEIDSAGCSALEHHVSGFAEFERLGLKVAPSAYDRALGYTRGNSDKQPDAVANSASAASATTATKS